MDRNASYQRFAAALTERGYRTTWQLGTRAEGMTVDCWLGGKLSPVLVQRHWNACPHELIGFDAYAPLTTSNKVDDIIKALDAQPEDLTLLPTETVERVTDALNALLGEHNFETIEHGRLVLRELATEIGKNR